jgi:hypothetical protein
MLVQPDGDELYLITSMIQSNEPRYRWSGPENLFVSNRFNAGCDVGSLSVDNTEVQAKRNESVVNVNCRRVFHHSLL